MAERRTTGRSGGAGRSRSGSSARTSAEREQLRQRRARERAREQERLARTRARDAERSRRASEREARRRERQKAREEERARQRAEDLAQRAAPKHGIDIPFLLLVLLLTAIGLLMLFSASYPSGIYEHGDGLYFIRDQLPKAIAGMALMLIISRFDYQWLRRLGGIGIAVSLLFLALVLVPGLGATRNNATRWLRYPFLWQPSELAKLAVVVYFSATVARKRDKMKTFIDGVLPYAAILGAMSILLIKEPHLSGLILIWVAGGAVLLVGGLAWKWVGLAAAAAGGVALAFLSGLIQYNQSRLELWHDPWIDPLGRGYQLAQSLITVGSGGILGVGLGRSRQKFLFLPEESNDFIFAVVCEELGLIGAAIIMLLFAALILRGYYISLKSRDRFGSLLVVGIITLYAMQIFLNIAVVTGLLPTTGISLPFFSFGGTAVIIQLASMGVVLSVSRQTRLASEVTPQDASDLDA